MTPQRIREVMLDLEDRASGRRGLLPSPEQQRAFVELRQAAHNQFESDLRSLVTLSLPGGSEDRAGNDLARTWARIGQETDFRMLEIIQRRSFNRQESEQIERANTLARDTVYGLLRDRSARGPTAAEEKLLAALESQQTSYLDHVASNLSDPVDIEAEGTALSADDRAKLTFLLEQAHSGISYLEQVGQLREQTSDELDLWVSLTECTGRHKDMEQAKNNRLGQSSADPSLHASLVAACETLSRAQDTLWSQRGDIEVDLSRNSRLQARINELESQRQGEAGVARGPR